jgi:hypothetical protein
MSVLDECAFDEIVPTMTSFCWRKAPAFQKLRQVFRHGDAAAQHHPIRPAIEFWQVR